ncbi:MAG: integration host factor subunit alpha [Deltaproteobacteria bacterium]|nr:integration host factor subunit alpha [Deltaproteobacteria bacterium]
MTLNKHDLIVSVSTKGGYSKNRSSNLVESLLDLIKSTLESGNDILISGFGKFCVKKKNERSGWNPRNGNAIYPDARRVVTFRSSPLLIGKINGTGKSD